MKKDLKCFEVVFPPQNKNNLVFFYTLKFEVIRRGVDFSGQHGREG